MHWWRARGRGPAPAPQGSASATASGGDVGGSERRTVAVRVDRRLDAAAARDLLVNAEAYPAEVSVVVDLTDVPSFDTDGAGLLLDAQDRLGPDRLAVVGLDAAARALVGSVATADAEARGGFALRVTRMRHLCVLQPTGPVPVDALVRAVTDALATDANIVVVDVRETTAMDGGHVHALAFASSEAAMRGRELLVANADDALAQALRAAGLGATTYLATEEFPPA